MRQVVLLFTALVFILSASVFADEIEGLKKDAALIQSRIELERARYQEAKAKIERSEVVAKYLLPELRAREKELKEKIKQEAGGKRQTGGGKKRTEGSD